jgi:2-methylisocitrate lyase-like PEP mutase family enzyme
MPTAAEKIATFRERHVAPGAFLTANPWDAGSARGLTGLGCTALATTSAGAACGLGTTGGSRPMTREAAPTGYGTTLRPVADLNRLRVKGAKPS